MLEERESSPVLPSLPQTLNSPGRGGLARGCGLTDRERSSERPLLWLPPMIRIPPVSRRPNWADDEMTLFPWQVILGFR